MGCSLWYLNIEIQHGHEQWFLNVLEQDGDFSTAMLVYQRVSDEVSYPPLLGMFHDISWDFQGFTLWEVV